MAAVDGSVVLEIGSAFIRLGLAGEATPRHVLPSPLSDWLPAAMYYQVDDSECIPLQQYTFSQWISKLTPLLTDIVYGKLLIKPKSRRILILEPMVSPTNFRNAIAHILFVTFGFPCLLFVSGSSSAALFSTGTSYGLVVDVGRAEARCAIHFDGQYVPQSFQAVPCGYENVVQLFQSYTTIPQLKYSFPDALVIVSIISTKGILASISPRTASGEEGVSPPVVAACALPSSGEILQINVNDVQDAWSESLDVNSDTSIPYMILTSLLQCPIDLRKIIAQNLLLVGGGGCFIPGFQERILSELQHGVRTIGKFRRLHALEMKFCKVPFSPDLIPWIGLSIMATLDLADEKWIHRETWLDEIKQNIDNKQKLDESNHEFSSRLIYDWLHV